MRRSRFVGPIWLGIVILGGCSPVPKPPSMVPNGPTARRLVDLALSAWEAGQIPGRVGTGSPRVEVIDTFRPSGRKAISHRVLGDLDDPNARIVTASVLLGDPEETVTVRYRVLGADPILVIRDEDFELLSHFEHKMPPADLAPEATPKATP